MANYTSEQFSEIGPSRWVLDDGSPDGIVCIGREGQTLQEFVDELNTPGVPVPPSIEDYSAAIQGALDVRAQERGYDSAASAVSYVTSGNPTWAAEAAAVRDWRDAVWVYALAQLALVIAGEREAPTVGDFAAEAVTACPFAWPE